MTAWQAVLAGSSYQDARRLREHQLGTCDGACTRYCQVSGRVRQVHAIDEPAGENQSSITGEVENSQRLIWKGQDNPRQSELLSSRSSLLQSHPLLPDAVNFGLKSSLHCLPSLYPASLPPSLACLPSDSIHPHTHPHPFSFPALHPPHTHSRQNT